MSKVLCECAQCGGEIYRSSIYFKDGEDNHFCSEDCAIDYHGIEESDYESETESDRYDWRKGA